MGQLTYRICKPRQRGFEFFRQIFCGGSVRATGKALILPPALPYGRTARRVYQRVHRYVRAEVITLGLKEVRGKPFGAVAVIVAKRCAEGRHGHSIFDCGLDGVAPALETPEDVTKVGIED